MSGRQGATIVIAIIVFITILGAIGWATSSFLGWDWRAILAGIRDLMIIFLALGSLLALIAIALLLYQILRSVQQIRSEIQPALDSVRQTTSNVRGTSTFIAETTIQPIIKVATTAAAVTKFAQVLVKGK